MMLHSIPSFLRKFCTLKFLVAEGLKLISCLLATMDLDFACFKDDILIHNYVIKDGQNAL